MAPYSARVQPQMSGFLRLPVLICIRPVQHDPLNVPVWPFGSSTKCDMAAKSWACALRYGSLVFAKAFDTSHGLAWVLPGNTDANAPAEIPVTIRMMSIANGARRRGERTSEFRMGQPRG